MTPAESELEDHINKHLATLVCQGLVRIIFDAGDEVVELTDKGAAVAYRIRARALDGSFATRNNHDPR